MTDRIWLKGDWHMHSRHSTDSTNNSIGRIIAFARSEGLDYLAITDHDNHVQGEVPSNTWADPEFASDDVLLFYGAELTVPRGHINILSTEAYDHPRIFAAGDARDWDLLALKKELGVHFSANHPNTKNHYGFSFDLADSLEFWNTSVWERNLLGLRIWDDMLLSGRMLAGRGGSDAHHGRPLKPQDRTEKSVEATANYIGTPTTWIHAETRTTQAVLRALEEGRASVSANPYAPRVELSAQTSDGATISMGQNGAATGAPVTFTVTLTGGGYPGTDYKVRIVRNRSEFALLDVTDPAGSLTFEDTPPAQGRSYYRVEILGPQTPYPAVPHSMARSGDMVALSNPVYFNYDPAF